MRWDPERYLTYAGERGRPFVELLTRVDPDGERDGGRAPQRVVDLGCGPGNLTALLAQRWPGADVLGVDSSAEMVAAAAAPGVRFEVGDLREWTPAGGPGSVDVLLTNATLQWVPGHLALLPGLLRAVGPGGWFAMQVPGNFDEPSHTLRDEVAAQEPFAEHVQDAVTPDAHDPADYLGALADVDGVDHVDAWETTYLHVLPAAADPDPVFTWVSGTGARPVLEALPADVRPAYEEQFKAALREAYPVRDVGGSPSVVMPFRRVFAVARAAGGADAG